MLIGTSPEQIQTLLNICQQHSIDNFYQFHSTKCKSFIFDDVNTTPQFLYSSEHIHFLQTKYKFDDLPTHIMSDIQTQSDGPNMIQVWTINDKLIDIQYNRLPLYVRKTFLNVYFHTLLNGDLILPKKKLNPQTS